MSSLVAHLNQIVTETFNRIGALAGLDILVVETYKYTLVCLDQDTASRPFLSVDRSRISTKGHVFGSSNVDASSLGAGGVGVDLGKLLSLTVGKLKQIS